MTQSPPETIWHSIDAEEALSRLDSSRGGLASAHAAQRLVEYGANTLPRKKRRTALILLLAQFKDFMIMVLLAAALISGVIGEAQDTIAILVIVLLNAVIGATQEFRAERAVAALRDMATPEAAVLRDGQYLTVAATELVPGDIVSLQAGNIIPADLRLLDVQEMRTDESALTGESQALGKTVDALPQPELPIGDRSNIAFKSTLVTAGTGCGVVIATGLSTEIGSIARLLQEEASVRTPLQQRLTRFGRYLALAILAICAVVFTAGLLQGQPSLLMFLTAVSLAVAAIPEALPAVVTVSLAMGARKLSLHRALVRNLPAVETLGSVTYICADKTGTLTQNRMTAELFIAANDRQTTLPSPLSGTAWQELGQAMALCNDIFEQDGEAAGEPTELALYEAAQQSGYEREALLETLPRTGVLSFDSERKRMTTLHHSAGETVAYLKGAPEQVIARCKQTLTNTGTAALNATETLEQASELTSKGYRVIAYAVRRIEPSQEPLQADAIERELTLLGLVAMIDPPRPEASQAVADCQDAGITPVMITGDHPGTAVAIARRLGIIEDQPSLLSGEELAGLNEQAFGAAVGSVRVYARVTPEQKLRIVKALQARGEFVAMTGDGVNDAPALKRAGIGIAMGQKGTDVAREASDMVLLDDDFATIVKAVRSGRVIFDNIRKFIKDTMSSNSGEIWTLFLAPFLGLPIPLLPIHILWINLVTDGLPGLAFSAEPEERGIMKRPPRPPQENIFSHGMWQHIVWVGLYIAGISLAAMAWAISRDVVHWQTVVFTVLTVSQLFHSLAVRSESESLFRIGLFTNLPMLAAVCVTLLLQLAVIYTPALNSVFHTQPLPLFDLAACLALSSSVLLVVEIEKWLVRRGLIYAGPESAVPG